MFYFSLMQTWQQTLCFLALSSLTKTIVDWVRLSVKEKWMIPKHALYQTCPLNQYPEVESVLGSLDEIRLEIVVDVSQVELPRGVTLLVSGDADVDVLEWAGGATD